MQITKGLKCVAVDRRHAQGPEGLDGLTELAFLASETLTSLEVRGGEVPVARLRRRYRLEDTLDQCIPLCTAGQPIVEALENEEPLRILPKFAAELQQLITWQVPQHCTWKHKQPDMSRFIARMKDDIPDEVRHTGRDLMSSSSGDGLDDIDPRMGKNLMKEVQVPP